MRIRLDNILLCILWLLAVTLGTAFWFNTIFGFDIFSATHWQYVSSLQAAQTPIKAGFYVSMAVSIFITIFGLYLIVRPRKRHIRLPILKISNQTTTQPSQQKEQKNSTPPVQNTDASTLDTPPAEMRPTQIPTAPTPPPSARPPRLNIPVSSHQYNSNKMATPQPRQQNNNYNVDQMAEIFTASGYTIKPNVRVNGITTSLIAIGTNETMWVGCVGVKTTDVRAILEKFEQIFSDTLDETYIGINGFVISAPDAATSEFQDILMFNTIDELRKYMQQNPNPPLPADDDGMFDAYSQYIDAVITHMVKV